MNYMRVVCGKLLYSLLCQYNIMCNKPENSSVIPLVSFVLFLT